MAYTRPPKAAGHNTYAGEVAAGKRDIIDVEVDADFDKLYGTMDGGIVNSNISDDAAIAYTKLALAGRILDRDLTFPPSHSPPGPSGGGVDAARLFGSLPTVTVPTNFITNINQLTPGTTVQFIEAASRADTFEITGLTNLFDRTYTSRGGHIFFIGVVTGYIELTTGVSDVHGVVHANIQRDFSVVVDATTHAEMTATGIAGTLRFPFTLVVPFNWAAIGPSFHVTLGTTRDALSAGVRAFHTFSAFLTCEQA